MLEDGIQAQLTTTFRHYDEDGFVYRSIVFPSPTDLRKFSIGGGLTLQTISMFDSFYKSLDFF